MPVESTDATDVVQGAVPGGALEAVLFYAVAASTLIGALDHVRRIQIWLRWTLPRIRLDQVLYACVQVLLPMTMLLLLGATLWVWASTSNSGGWATFDALVRAILGAIGAVFVMGFVGIAGYGFYHRRRLVGNLAIDALPGG